MTATKVRIYELSKSLGVSNKDVIDALKAEFGVDVKSHASSIDQDVADKIESILKQGSAKPAKSAEPKPAEPKVVEKATEKPAAAKAPVEKTPEIKAAEIKTPAKSEPASQPPKPQPKAPETTAKAPTKPATATQAPARPAQPTQPAASRPTQVATQTPPQPASRPAQPAAQARPQAPAAQSAGSATRQPQQPRPTQSATALAPRTEAPKTDVAKAPAAQADTQATVTDVRQPAPEMTSGSKKDAGTDAEEINIDDLPIVMIKEPISIRDLATLVQKRETELIKHLFMKGVMVNVNQTLTIDDAVKLSREMGINAHAPEDETKLLALMSAPELIVKETKGKNLAPRAPVISIMGHVDHGKTSLLDAIRETRHKIVDTEAGGITQRVGAYTVEKDGKKIVFIDTPGHAAFTAMRMRGARATDIAILVVAADDGVMPQTIEAINHAKAANIPIIVAVNKIDKPDADPDKVLAQLTEYGLNAEKWGGDVITVEVSALQKLGLEDLLESILLVSELQELKADAAIPGEGVVIEARLDKGKGPVASVLVQNGTLSIGDNVLIGAVGGRVRALINDSGERIESAGPSSPVTILGLSDVPAAGDLFQVISSNADFKRQLQERQLAEREQRLSSKIAAAPGMMSTDEVKDFYLIVKGDSHGTVEAVTQSLLQLATNEITVHILHSGTGDVSESDIMLASANNAIVIAFNVKEETNAARLAQDQGIQVRPYDIIYHVTEDMEKLMLGLLDPDKHEQELGYAEVRQLFSIGKTVIAGCRVMEGKIQRGAIARVIRGGKQIHEGAVDNLKRFKDDAKEVAAGYECGISIDKFNSLEVGDEIHVYVMKEVERTSL